MTVCDDPWRQAFRIRARPLPVARALARALAACAAGCVPGTAITQVRFAGVDSVFTRPPGLHEPLHAIGLALADVALRWAEPGDEYRLAVGGPRDLTAWDLSAACGLEVVDPSHRLARLAPGGSLAFGFTVESGTGRQPAVAPPGPRGAMSLPVTFTPLRDWLECERDGVMHVVVSTNGAVGPADLLAAAGDALRGCLQALSHREASWISKGQGRTVQATGLELTSAGQTAVTVLLRSLLGVGLELVDTTDNSASWSYFDPADQAPQALVQALRQAERLVGQVAAAPDPPPPAWLPAPDLSPAPLVEAPAWLEPVRESHRRLREVLLPRALAAVFPLWSSGRQVALRLLSVGCPAPELGWTTCLDAGVSYLGAVTVEAVIERDGQEQARATARLGWLPWPTSRGTVVIDGQERLPLAEGGLDADWPARLAAVADGSLRRAAPALAEALGQRASQPGGLVAVLAELPLTADWLAVLREPEVGAAVDDRGPLSLLLQAAADSAEDAPSRTGVGLWRRRLGAASPPPNPVGPAFLAGWIAAALVPGEPPADRLVFAAGRPLLAGEPPWLATGEEEQVAAAARLVRRAVSSGRVEAVGPRGIELAGQPVIIPPYEVGRRGSLLPWRLAATVGQSLGPGDLIASGPGVAAGWLALGRHLLVVEAEGDEWPAGGLVVSDRVASDPRWHWIELRQVVAPAGPEWQLTRETSDDPRTLNHRGVIQPGAVVQTGQVLIGRRDRHGHDESIRCPGGGPWQVVEQITLPPDQVSGQPERIRLRLAAVRGLGVGARLVDRQGTVSRVVAVRPAEQMPLLADGRAVDAVVVGGADWPPASWREAWRGLASQRRGRRLTAPGGGKVDEAGLAAEAGLAPDGRAAVWSGRDGSAWPSPALVGLAYLARLS